MADVDWEDICKILVVGGGGVGAVVLTPALLASLGFTAGGIVAGSIAAKIMAYFAALNGGQIIAGGFVALLQSLGAAGLSVPGTVLTGGAGGIVGWILSNICNQTTSN